MIALSIALVAVIGMVIAVPTLLPRSLRDAVGLGPERVAEVPQVADAGSYAFLAHQPDDRSQPVGYDPCSRIKLRINPASGPADGVSMVRRAMREVEQATGLRFDYQGTTDARPKWENASVPVIFGRPRTVPVLVSWATEDEVGELAGNVAGVGGSLPLEDGDRTRFVTGGVTLDADVFAEGDGTARGRRELFAIVLHELGHLVGLAHVHDPHELMNEDNLGLLDFGPGDRAGLARVGSTPCA